MSDDKNVIPINKRVRQSIEQGQPLKEIEDTEITLVRIRQYGDSAMRTMQHLSEYLHSDNLEVRHAAAQMIGRVISIPADLTMNLDKE